MPVSCAKTPLSLFYINHKQLYFLILITTLTLLQVICRSSLCFSFPGTLVFPAELVREQLGVCSGCCHSSSSGRTFQMFLTLVWRQLWHKDNKNLIISCCRLCVPVRSESVCLFCMCSQCRVSLSDSSPSMLCSLTSIHWLTAYFYLFTTCEFAVVMSVVSGWRSMPSRPRFIPVICSPRSWAASAKPSTPPRRLWRRNMPDVSFTKKKTGNPFSNWGLCSVHSVGIHYGW